MHKVKTDTLIKIFLLILGIFFTTLVNAESITNLRQFTGHWTGQLNQTTVDLQIFVSDNSLNATAKFDKNRTNLEYLGFKSSFSGVYFWREGDKAPLCLFFENGQLNMTYFEKDNIRKTVLLLQ